MAKYLGYVSGGVCRDTHAQTKDEDGNPIRVGMIRKQLWVIEELRRQGIQAWCGTKVDYVRQGKQKEWTRQDVPALPNYIVVDMRPDQMFDVISTEHVMPVMEPINGAALYGVKPCRMYPNGLVGLIAFMDETEAAFAEAERVDANSRASVTAYKKGQELRVTRGPFVDMLVTFDKLVRRPGSKWQTLAVETDGGLKVEFDPMDVKSA